LSLYQRLRAQLRPLASGLRHLRRSARGIPQPGTVDFGDLRRTSPLCADYGYDRGLPIDRIYIEAFIAKHTADLRGCVLEVQEDDYARRFGGTAVERCDVLDLDPTNPRATVIADLTDAPQLAAESYDAIILTQTLQLIYDLDAAVATLHRLLKPGGVLLCTVSGISSVGRSGGEDAQWCWSFTPGSLQRLLAARFEPDAVSAEAFGNVLTAVAFLEGLAAAELEPAEFEARDPAYPVVVAARALKAAHPR